MKYLLFATVGTALFFAVYWISMRKEARFQMVRFYLVATLVLSMLLPLIHINITTSAGNKTIEETISTKTMLGDETIVVATGFQPVASQPAEPTKRIPWLVIIYFAGCLGMLAVLVTRLTKTLARLRKLEYDTTDGMKLAFLDDNTTAYSLFNYIVIGRSTFTAEELSLLVGHEKVHVAQCHTLDNLFAEVVKVFFWFDPFAWLYARELRRIHEYIADHEMLSTNHGETYAELFFHQASGHRYGSLGNNFDHKLTKKRINMMTQRKNTLGGLKPLFALPIVAILLLLSCKLNTSAPLSGRYDLCLSGMKINEAGVSLNMPFDKIALTLDFRSGNKVVVSSDLFNGKKTCRYWTSDNILNILTPSGSDTLHLNIDYNDGDSLALSCAPDSPLAGLYIAQMSTSGHASSFNNADSTFVLSDDGKTATQTTTSRTISSHIWAGNSSADSIMALLNSEISSSSMPASIADSLLNVVSSHVTTSGNFFTTTPSTANGTHTYTRTTTIVNGNVVSDSEESHSGLSNQSHLYFCMKKGR